MDRKLAGIILAAGKGTRMKSDQPKCAMPVLGVPLGGLVGRAMKQAGADPVVVVVGHKAEVMQAALGNTYRYAFQSLQKGTGHAALMANQALSDFHGDVLVSAGDLPLLSGDALAHLHARHLAGGNHMTVATVVFDDPTGYGRILRDADGKPCGIVEEKDATPEQRALKEVCVSVYCFDCQTMLRLLPTLSSQNAQGEYYLTDMLEAVYKDGGRVETVVYADAAVMTGVNDRWQLALAAQELRLRILRRHALEGVSIVDPGTAFIGPDVRIEKDVVIHPSTVIEGHTTIGEGAEIGPNTLIRDSRVGAGASVLMSHVNRADIGNDVRVGPFANLRPHSHLAKGVKIGNFVEVKNTRIGENASVSHLTYLGDAEIGARTNIGAGTITCNYDGFFKHRTHIGEGAFVGSNSTLVAPVSVGDGAIVAAGSVVTQDVPAEGLALGRARQENKEAWAKAWREKKQALKDKGTKPT
ncbi:MAG: bifunctional UDP-N-acetylglucosamine diphosphorylase/glucosamine-1-phosphate N-acetyltransferase GlmU [Fimbriimonadaceae bacterium]|nr:bifunctional UDP-N-acetylglucosamine diphosphorylase/glucosamine-1-phosphate N-acetyltransferase GlmU [Fimbriimonadaceae bacterium]